MTYTLVESAAIRFHWLLRPMRRAKDQPAGSRLSGFVRLAHSTHSDAYLWPSEVLVRPCSRCESIIDSKDAVNVQFPVEYCIIDLRGRAGFTVKPVHLTRASASAPTARELF
jgi:hypothetical protein